MNLFKKVNTNSMYLENISSYVALVNCNSEIMQLTVLLNYSYSLCIISIQMTLPYVAI